MKMSRLVIIAKQKDKSLKQTFPMKRKKKQKKKKNMNNNQEDIDFILKIKS